MCHYFPGVATTFRSNDGHKQGAPYCFNFFITTIHRGQTPDRLLEALDCVHKEVDKRWAHDRPWTDVVLMFPYGMMPWNNFKQASATHVAIKMMAAPADL
jgi:hypothetical protein